MKLYNRTRVADTAVHDALVSAGRAVGARTAGVVVIVNQGRRPVSSGSAKRATVVVGLPRRASARRWAYVYPRMRFSREQDGLVGMRRVKTDGGYFCIVMPAPWPGTLPKIRSGEIEPPWDFMAHGFWSLARHEWAHVVDYQSGMILPWSRESRHGRRPPWSSRPEEQRAEAACDDADALGKSREWAAREIAALARALEQRFIV